MTIRSGWDALGKTSRPAPVETGIMDIDTSKNEVRVTWQQITKLTGDLIPMPPHVGLPGEPWHLAGVFPMAPVRDEEPAVVGLVWFRERDNPVTASAGLPAASGSTGERSGSSRPKTASRRPPARK